MNARTLFCVAALLLCPALHAQDGHPPFCTSPLIPGPADQSGHLAFSPANPDSTHPTTITTGRHIFIPSEISSAVLGRVIDIYVTGQVDQFTTPAGDMCLSTSLEPLEPGTYTVDVYSIDTTLPNDPPLLFLSETLSVAGGVLQPVSAPTISLAALAALGSLLSVAALFALHRRRDGPHLRKI